MPLHWPRCILRQPFCYSLNILSLWFLLTTFCKSHRCIIASLNWKASVDVMKAQLCVDESLLWCCQTFTLEWPKLIINDMFTNISFSERKWTNFFYKQSKLESQNSSNGYEVQVCNKVDPSWHWSHLQNIIKIFPWLCRLISIFFVTAWRTRADFGIATF